MPTRLPVANRAQTRPVQRSRKTFDLSCAGLGAAAIGLSVFVGRFCYDRIGAVLILLMAGGLVAVLMFGLSQGPLERRPPSN